MKCRMTNPNHASRKVSSMTEQNTSALRVAVIGAGPAGIYASD